MGGACMGGLVWKVTSQLQWLTHTAHGESGDVFPPWAGLQCNSLRVHLLSGRMQLPLSFYSRKVMLEFSIHWQLWIKCIGSNLQIGKWMNFFLYNCCVFLCFCHCNAVFSTLMLSSTWYWSILPVLLVSCWQPWTLPCRDFLISSSFLETSGPDIIITSPILCSLPPLLPQALGQKLKETMVDLLYIKTC